MATSDHFTSGDYSGEISTTGEGISLSSLISSLSSPSPTTQLHAATLLRHVTKHNPSLRHSIAVAGAIRPLIPLLTSPNLLLQSESVTTVLNLSLSAPNLPLLASAGAVRALVAALSSPSQTSRASAACSLLHLSRLPHLAAVIGPAGAIPPLVRLLETGVLRGKKDAATAIYSLCVSGDENKVRAVDAGVVRVLLDIMAEVESGMVDKAAFVLAEVVEVEVGRRKVLEDGGVPVLVELVEVGTRRQKEVVVDVLLKVCEGGESVRRLVVAEGVVPALVEVVRCGGSRAGKKAKALIALLTKPSSDSLS